MRRSRSSVILKPHYFPGRYIEDMFTQGFSIYKDKIIIVDGIMKEDLMYIIDHLNLRQLDNLIAIRGDKIYVSFVWKNYIPKKYSGKYSSQYGRVNQYARANNVVYRISFSSIYP